MWLGIRRRRRRLARVCVMRDVMIDFEARNLMTGDERTKSVGVSHFYFLVGLESATYVQVRSPESATYVRTSQVATSMRDVKANRWRFGTIFEQSVLDPLPPNY